MALIKFCLTWVLSDDFKLTWVYLNEGDKVCEFNSCLKLMIQAHLPGDFYYNIFC